MQPGVGPKIVWGKIGQINVTYLGLFKAGGTHKADVNSRIHEELSKVR